MSGGFEGFRMLFEVPVWYRRMALARLFGRPRKRLRANVQLEMLKKIRRMTEENKHDQ